MPLRFINPNYHVILVHYPLGVFVLGVFLELFSLLWRKGSIRVAAVWMIMLGAFLSLPAVTSGIYALYDVSHWQPGITGERYYMLKMHTISQSISSLLAVLCAIIGLGASDRWRERLRLPLLLGVVIACAGMIYGSWNGGEAIYKHGTAVQAVDSDGELQNTPKPFKNQYQKVTRYYVGGEMQVHMIVAGFALSAVVGALGLSIRRLSTHLAEEAQLRAEAGLSRPPAASPRGEPRRVTDDLTVIRSFNPEAEVEADLAHVPAGRWWLVTGGMTVLTAALGYWIMSKSHFADAKGWKELTETLEWPNSWNWPDIKRWEISRHVAHLVLGGAMFVLALMLGLIARFAPRRPLVLTFFATLMVLAVSAEVWMGIALTFDEEGPLTRFNKVDKTAESHESSSSSAPETPAATEPAAPVAAPTSAPAIAPAIAPATAPATAPTTAP